MHLKVIQLFVESVLRYGLPAHYVGFFIKVSPFRAPHARPDGTSPSPFRSRNRRRRSAPSRRSSPNWRTSAAEGASRRAKRAAPLARSSAASTRRSSSRSTSTSCSSRYPGSCSDLPRAEQGGAGKGGGRTNITTTHAGGSSAAGAPHRTDLQVSVLQHYLVSPLNIHSHTLFHAARGDDPRSRPAARSKPGEARHVCMRRSLRGRTLARRKQSRTSCWRESGRGRCEEKGQIVCELLTVRVR